MSDDKLNLSSDFDAYDSNEQAETANIPVEERLAQFGVPDELISEYRKGQMLQADYTRKTQEVADMRRSMEFQQAQLNQMAAWVGQQQAQQPRPKSNLEAKWEHWTGGEDKPEFAPIKDFLSAQAEDVKAEIGGELKTLKQQLAMYQADDYLKQMHNETVKPNFGDHLDHVWPEAVQLSKQHMVQTGQFIDPLTIITQKRPDLIREAAVKHAGGIQKTNGQLSEGMVEQRYDRPIVGQPPAHKGPADSTANILAEVRAMYRGRPSA